ncbi:MAG: hypothetical protein K8L97_33095 [Anaerolineae bacterium]|nr:hypothetical protein [Anaerolineae bacterium]
MMLRILRWLYLIFIGLITFLVLVVNVRLYMGIDTDDVPEQLRFIRSALENGAADEMQAYFPEGYFFSYALYGLAWVDLGIDRGGLREKALTEARWALEHLDSEAGRAVFSPSLNPHYGVFYVGWSNWLRGGILKMQPVDERDEAEIERYRMEADNLAAAYADSETPFLSAYPGQAWPVDNVVAVASLALYDSMFTPPRYTDTVTGWLESAQAHLDPTTGLLPHRVDAQTGDMVDGARGSSQSIINRFLTVIDPVWAQAQYRLFREQFVTTVLGIPGVREYPLGVDGVGDVDSGSLIAGISLSATVVTAGAARLQDDDALADPIFNAGEALGMPISLGGAKRYAFGLLPIGDAFVAWAKSAVPLTVIPSIQLQNPPPIVNPGWRIPIHGITILFLSILWLPIIKQLKAKRSWRTA